MSSLLKVSADQPALENSNLNAVKMPKKWLKIARAAWIVFAMTGIGLFLTSLPGYWLRFSSGAAGGSLVNATTVSQFSNIAGGILSLGAVLLSVGLAVFLFIQRFENIAVMVVSFYLLLYGIVMAGVMEVWSGYWIGNTNFVNSLQGLLLGTPTIAMFALFPNGQFIPKWMRWVVLVSIPFNIIFFLVSPATFDQLDNSLTSIMFVLWLLLLPGLGIYAQIHRYRNVSTSDERQQTKWVLFGLGLWTSYIVLSTPPYLYLMNLPPGSAMPWWAILFDAGWWLSLLILPISLTIAITRYRLWNVDFVINRTLVYSVLTMLTVGFYIFVVGYLGRLLHAIDQSVIAFFATGLVAVLFQPLRERIQRAVNRMMYGDRDDPFAVLVALSETLESAGSPEDALESIIETIARTLKLPYAAIELGSQVIAYGIENSDTIDLPLTYQSEVIGYLRVGPRSPGEAFRSGEMLLLENVAQRAGAAAHAAKLTADLRRSRQKLIQLREEERSRIRRDLHDGLGPMLASMTLKLDAVRNYLNGSPDKAETMLVDLKQQTVEMIRDIRTLVYQLRPPALDELGLVGAIRNHIDLNVTAPPNVHFEPQDPLPSLNPAVEAAIYRTALEGITNILRHARAQSASIRLFMREDDVILEIQDDGIGLAESGLPGVGLRSMRERAEELGGRFEILPSDQGLHLRTCFPVKAEDENE